MPTISVDKVALYKALGKDYTREEFDELCFEFGIELDDDTTGIEEPAQLKIEIPANRYDMLCFEGIAMNLNVFLGRQEVPQYKLKAPADGKLLEVTVKPETQQVRQYFSCAILRGIKFDKAKYDSFIALQDKLHQNLARQRSLVAIGTHDLSTLKGPFTYEALPPDQIKFAPLNQEKEMNGKEMMEFYEVRATGDYAWRCLWLSADHIQPFICRLIEISPHMHLTDSLTEGPPAQEILAHHSGQARLPHHLRCQPHSSVDAAYHQQQPL
jgi:phenylalanyl-tRNA synthetase beta chain